MVFELQNFIHDTVVKRNLPFCRSRDYTPPLVYIVPDCAAELRVRRNMAGLQVTLYLLAAAFVARATLTELDLALLPQSECRNYKYYSAHLESLPRYISNFLTFWLVAILQVENITHPTL